MVAPFNLLESYLRGKTNGAKKNKVFVFFMTAGLDTYNDMRSVMLVSDIVSTTLAGVVENLSSLGK